MSNDNNINPWSTANLANIEASLWREEQGLFSDLAWLDLSWKEPAQFWKSLHDYWKIEQGMRSKTVPLSCYDFYHDLMTKEKDPSPPAYVWFDGNDWQTWSYAELRLAVRGLAAFWEESGVQAGETLAILHQPGPERITAILAGLRLGVVISLLPPQGDTFIQHRLENLAPQWLVMNHLYRHRLDTEWQEITLPHTLSSSPPQRQAHLYLHSEIILKSFDPTSLTPDEPYSVEAGTLYLGALRDGIFALGLKPKQACAAPYWHPMESQPSLLLTILLQGASWVHIELGALKQKPERLLEQPIDVLGISASLRDLLRDNPLIGEKTWKYWFRHPAESHDLRPWLDFVEKMELQECYSGNLLWNTILGGAILFSSRCKGQPHHESVPAAGMLWQFGVIASPDLPCLDDSGRIALGKEEEEEIVWTATPHILARYLDTWHYLGNYPRGRVGRTYPRQEILEVLSVCEPYLALIESFISGGDADPRQVLLVFGENVDVEALEECIKLEMGNEFLPDRIEVLPFLPKRNEEGGADQEWCQLHYQGGGLYRRQRSEIFRCLSELKQKVLA